MKPILIPTAILLVSMPVRAQDSTDAEEEVFELSPFEVSTSENIGYLTNNTLAGTRINSQLSDIANSVQVITKEFLEDTGATELSELLVYTTSTEAYGTEGNASLSGLDNNSNNSHGSRREPQLSTRVRALASADIARDYFLSDLPFDPYNTSEVTINRGPNASLFGLGSPGGIVNNAIDKAQTGRTFGEINLNFDEYESLRASLNYNKVVIEDKFAVRVAALDSNQRWEQEQAKFDEERFFVAATLRPFKNTAIRVNYETSEGSGNRPMLRPPTDRITPWFNNGKFGYDLLKDEWYQNGELVTDPARINELARLVRPFPETSNALRPVMFFDDPNSSTPGNNTYAVMQVALARDQAGRPGQFYIPIDGEDQLIKREKVSFLKMVHGPLNLFTRDPNYVVGARPEIPVSHIPYYKDPQVADLDIFNIRKHSLAGAGDVVHMHDFDVYSIRAEQTWFNNNLGIELAYQEQEYEADLIEPYTRDATSSLNVDVNLRLWDGTPNPNFGRPVVAGRGYAQAAVRDRDAFQATSFAKYDFNEKHDGWLKHLGRHTLTGVYQDQTSSLLSKNRQNAIAGRAYYPSVARGGPGLTQAEALRDTEYAQQHAQVLKVQYLGPSMVNANSIADAEIQGVSVPQLIQSTDNTLIWNPFAGGGPGGGAFEQIPLEIYTAQENPAEANRVTTYRRSQDEIESAVTVLQSHFLNDHIVTTFSWRRDTVASFEGEATNDPETGLVPLGEPVELGDPFIEETLEQTSYGVVAYVPEKWLPRGIGLSAHYVDSQNFVAGASTVDIFNRPAPPQTGTTEEYGVALSAMDGKLYARINFFETAQQFERGGSATAEVGRAIVRVMEANTPEQLAAAGWDLYDGSLFDPGMIETLNLTPADPNVPNDQTTWLQSPSSNWFRDTLSEGMEVEISFAPTSNWRLHLNVAQVEAITDNVMPFAKDELFRIANEVFEDPIIGNLFYADEPIPISGSGTTGDPFVYDTQDLLRSRDDNVIREIAYATANEGLPMSEIREWRWNLVTNYSFDGPKWEDTWLSGFAVGTGIRWQDESSIGSGLKEVDFEDGAIVVPDLDNLYYGPSETNIDAWISYSIDFLNDTKLWLQLRVRNLNSGSGDFIPVYANPDGEIALWRIGPRRWFEFSARLRF